LLLLLFIVVPAVELALLIEVGRRIGTVATLGVIVVTGVLGASLARHQGLQVLRHVEREMGAGRLPGGALIDAVLILIAAALLVTPGLLTDVTGFLCLLPGTRRLIKRALLRWFERRLRAGHGQVRVHVVDVGQPRDEGPVYDVTPERDDRGDDCGDKS
jgi:UPF0716 protein FxsA